MSLAFASKGAGRTLKAAIVAEKSRLDTPKSRRALKSFIPGKVRKILVLKFEGLKVVPDSKLGTGPEGFC